MTDPRLAYAVDRAEIQDLQARYLFALDWFDADAYADCFTEDGVLDWALGIVEGRETIRAEAHGMPKALAAYFADDGSGRPKRLRHYITNIVVQIAGDRATGQAYWMETSNDTPDGSARIGGFGHYQDELHRVNGKWLFSRRKIFNELLDGRCAEASNPVREMGGER
jgi:hypothetical protein